MKCATCIYFNPARANPFSVGECMLHQISAEIAYRDANLCNEGTQKVEMTRAKTTGVIEA